VAGKKNLSGDKTMVIGTIRSIIKAKQESIT